MSLKTYFDLFFSFFGFNDRIDVSNELPSHAQAEEDLNDQVLELSQSMKRSLSLKFENTKNLVSMSSI